MNNDLISREALRKAFHERIYYFNKSSWDEANAIIDNAPTVPLPDFKAGYKQAIIDGKTQYQRQQGEWIRKEDVIHSIAKQYSEHNELVPIWLSIGDMKGGAE